MLKWCHRNHSSDSGHTLDLVPCAGWKFTSHRSVISLATQCYTAQQLYKAFAQLDFTDSLKLILPLQIAWFHSPSGNNHELPGVGTSRTWICGQLSGCTGLGTMEQWCPWQGFVFANVLQKHEFWTLSLSLPSDTDHICCFLFLFWWWIVSKPLMGLCVLLFWSTKYKYFYLSIYLL